MSASPSDLFSEPTCHPEGPKILSQLLQSLERSKHLANFACGGSVPVTAPAKPSSEGISYPRPSGPVVIRWDGQTQSSEDELGIGYRGRKVIFPNTAQHSEAVSSLVAACQPATFGRGQQDVLDETYRKAGKLDPTRFSTNFCPHETGIIDAVTTVLLNETVCEKDHVSLGLWAELYKLNVYSGPSGKLKAHVDTPRSDKQFGSLVICLPFPHSGGALEVRHEGKVAKFDWSVTSAQASQIQWAAFYSDCEHEVLEVTSGHRITLTYNLYHKVVLTSSPSVPLPIDGKQIPFHSTMLSLMRMPEFLPEGGLLGIFCSHSYPHTDRLHYLKIPFMLKGADAAIYRSLSELPGVSIQLLPILPKVEDYGLLYDYEEELFGKEEGKPERVSWDVDEVSLNNDSKLATRFDGSFDTLHKKVFPELHPPPETYEQYKQRIGPSAVHPRIFHHQNRIVQTMKSHLSLAGVKIQPFTENYGYRCESTSHLKQSFDELFPLQILRNVQWLNSRHSKELSMVYLAYGNEASTEHVYSSLSFIITIPPYRERQ